MTLKISLIKPLAVAALLGAASGASQAAITVFTSLTAFNAATAAQGTDTFAGLSTIVPTASPLNRTAGPYSYRATVTNTFFAGGTVANPFLATTDAEDTVRFTAFAAGVRGIGGNFFASNIAGGFTLGSVTLTVTDGGGSVTRVITDAAVNSFLGFVSDGPISLLTLAAVQPTDGSFTWPSADNLVLAAAIPEPGTYALLLMGLGAVGFAARRRRG